MRSFILHRTMVHVPFLTVVSKSCHLSAGTAGGVKLRRHDVLAFFWLWMGIAYYWMSFRNKARMNHAEHAREHA